MAIDFFQQQDLARRKTGLLVFYFVLAILCLVALVYALLLVVSGFESEQPVTLWQPGLLAAVTAGVVIVVGGASAVKVAQLASGGQSVALMMGGAEIPGTSRDARERRLLNIVEEMAIAAGVPVPPVYILDEPGINAFAAGYSPGDAVVAVSRGCLQYLNRDELQGVVAHEFSHILNGDMRLNIRLMGLIFGIMALSVIGRILMYSSNRSYSSSNRSYSSSNRKDSGGGGIVMLGLGLFILGMVGAFFGRLIQAAVSRQREFLADASAVQFTRNPDGIAGALKKIGGLSEGSHINNPRAGEVAHMFFASNLRADFGGMLATHPPLDERIRRLDPSFTGEYPVVEQVGVDRKDDDKPRPTRPPPLPRIPGLPQVPLPLPVLGLAEQAAASVGQIAPTALQHAEALHAEIPAALADAAQEPFGARALVYALLLDPHADLRNQQLAQLKSSAEPADFTATLRLSPEVQSLPDALRLPLLDIAMPALRQMSPRQHQVFRAQVEALISADRQLSLFEYTLRCVLHRHLDAQFQLPRPPQTPVQTSPQPLATPVAQVLSMLAWEGQDKPDDAAAAFAAGMRSYVGGDHSYQLPPRANCTLAAFDGALQALSLTVLAIKRRTIIACAACILKDQVVTVREFELLRAICDLLDCPLPPLAKQTA